MELLSASFALINFPFTLMLLLVVLYWASVIVGALDISALDFSLDVDSLEGGVEADAGGDAAAEAGGVLRGLLHYLYIGEVPLTIVLSILAVSLWAFAVLANHYLNPGQSLGLAALLFVPNLLISAQLARFVSAPLRKLFRAIDGEALASVRLVGRRCRVVTSQVTPEFGQADVDGGGAPIRLSVRTRGGEILPQGADAVILESDPETRVHIVTRLELDV